MPTHPLTLLALGPEDARLAADFVHRLIVELSGDPDIPTSPYREAAADLLGSGRIGGAKALVAGQVAGLILLDDCAAIYAGGRFGEITELYVLPGYRSQGVAARLIGWAVAQGQARGWRRIEVGAPALPEWQRSFDFYRREGFAEVGPRLRRLL
ncbi:GNAT family N-acetyltransferase [Gemmobacter lutimaris]|uniref:GNAT family N-acetyltransferase n=1 Tax=Gemmobacter lutimaris TaxID=2306023 RepID=A0A398C089_9RHOB|nr:GNAT family N-acetyltransferase [Gemmobacter lutimaris]RID92973.1 GNAT family N-acetyltransferase [Gemmobacter lutimaris]